MGTFITVAKPWIAGESRNDAIRRAIQLNRQGMKATLHYVGEFSNGLASVENATKEYVQLIKEIKRTGINASVSVKLSEIGLKFSKKLCTRELKEILDAGQKANVFVWIEPEGFANADTAIEVYLQVLPIYPDTGISVETALKRSQKDIATLLKIDAATLRLVKGAYKQPPYRAATETAAITKQFIAGMKHVFSRRAYCAIATNDVPLIEHARVFGKRDEFEFHLRMGMNNKVKQQLTRQHYIVSEYVPYGTNWKWYVAERIREKKRNIPRALHALFT